MDRFAGISCAPSIRPKARRLNPRPKNARHEQSDPSNVPPQDVSNRYDEELANAPAEQPHEPLDPSALHDEAQERSKQRPILQKILNLFQKEKADFRELIINSEPLEKRVALLVDGILEKFEIERESDNRDGWRNLQGSDQEPSIPD